MDRRSFCGRAATALAGLVALPSIVRALSPETGAPMAAPTTARVAAPRHLEEMINRAIRPLGYVLALQREANRRAIRGEVFKLLDHRPSVSFLVSLTAGPANKARRAETIHRQIRYCTARGMQQLGYGDRGSALMAMRGRG